MSKIRTIGRLAKEVGVNVETIRFYERQGLLAQPRKAQGPRHYDDQAAATLRYIRLAQQFGLSLKNVRALQDELGEGGSFCGSLRAMVEDKLVALDAEAARIVALKVELEAFLARCRAHDPAVPCPIVRELTHLDAVMTATASPTQRAAL